MRFFPDILSDLLDVMDVSICVVSAEDLGSNIWKLSVCDCSTTLHAAPGRIITDGNSAEYTIVAVENDSYFTVESLTEPPTGNWYLPRVSMKHGTPMTVSAEIGRDQSNIDRFPLVWVLEVTGEERDYSPKSDIEMTPDARVFFLDFADFVSGTSDTLYDNPVKPMSNFADRVIKEGKRLGIWDWPMRATYYPWSKLGMNYTNPKTADRNSALSSYVPDHTGGIELRIQIPIFK